MHQEMSACGLSAFQKFPSAWMVHQQLRGGSVSGTPEGYEGKAWACFPMSYKLEVPHSLRWAVERKKVGEEHEMDRTFPAASAHPPHVPQDF